LLCLTDTSLYIYICVKHFGVAKIKKEFSGNDEDRQVTRITHAWIIPLGLPHWLPREMAPPLRILKGTIGIYKNVVTLYQFTWRHTTRRFLISNYLVRWGMIRGYQSLYHLLRKKPRITYLTITLLDNQSTQTLTRLTDGAVQHKIDDGQRLRKNTYVV